MKRIFLASAAIAVALWALPVHAAEKLVVSAWGSDIYRRNEQSAWSISRLKAGLARADMILGISAGVLLAAGLLRVFYFEKGAAYYFHSATFIAKLALFVLVAVLSIYPTVKFIAWRKGIDASSVPAIRRIIHLELAGIVLILLFAALMADGIGYWG